MAPNLFENEYSSRHFYSEPNCGPLYGCPASEAGMEIREVLDEIMDLMDWTQVRLAKAIGVSQGTISKWRSGQQGPGKEEWDQVTALIQKQAKLEPLRFQTPSSGDVLIMGRVGAGAVIDPDFEQVPPEGLGQVTLPFPLAPGMIAFEVFGDSMYPKYDPGDIIVVREKQIRSTESFVGQLAAVRTRDGRRYLKEIEMGTRMGLFRLESFRAPAIQDVEIAWVGEIQVVVPAARALPVERAARSPKPAPKSARR